MLVSRDALFWASKSWPPFTAIIKLRRTRTLLWLYPYERRKSYIPRMARGWATHGEIFSFGRTIPLRGALSFKGIVHPKNENSVINYSPSCRSRHVRPSFIFRTQFKMFLMKSQSYLTLHRQQRNWTVPRSRNIVYTSVKRSMWHQWLNFSFVTLREYFFLVQRKQK